MTAPHHDRCASLLGQGCDCRDPWATDTAGITTDADDERRRLGIPRTRETPCAVDGCDVTSPLHRVNPKGDLGIFMCPEHARRIG